jgi:hypothetical protein
METEAKNILERIFNMSGLVLKQTAVKEFNCDSERKRKITIEDPSSPENNVWLNKDEGDIDSMKYDELIVTYENDEHDDLIYGILIEYIRENKLFKICESDGSCESRVRFVIPSFSSLPELQIKLDML